MFKKNISSRDQIEFYVIDPAVSRPEIDCFNLISRLAPTSCSYHLPAMVGMNSLLPGEDSGLHRIVGIIILGSSAHVLDNQPWQAPFHDWVLHQIKSEIPILGICYGHQLISSLLGAKLGRNKNAEKGLRKIDVVSDTGILTRGSSSKMVVSHFEYVKDCPQDMSVWLQSPQYEFDGFKHKKYPVWTVQAHPEATESFCRGSNLGSGFAPEDFSAGHSLIRSFLLNAYKQFKRMS